jgi:ferredoxin-NADP reductase
MFVTKSIVLKKAYVLTDEAECSHVVLSFQRRGKILPGTWFSLSSSQANSTLSHPFTAIVLSQDVHGETAVQAQTKFNFVLKAGRSGWVRRLHTWIKENPKSLPSVLVSGPYGGGLGSLDAMESIVFVVAGVGFTPAASMAAELHRKKAVHVIWTFRSLALYIDGRAYFAEIPREQMHCYLSKERGLPGEPQGVQGVGLMDLAGNVIEDPHEVRLGRPDLPQLFEIVASGAASRSVYDIGVFVCGPQTLVASALQTTAALNKSKAGSGTHFHVHSESFQM